jgi:putative transposase
MQNFKNDHKPPHYFSDNTIYFITAATYHKTPFFDNNPKKEILKNILKEKAAKFSVDIFAFVIMDNHYHLLIKIKKGEDLKGFIKGINGKSAYLLNEMDNVAERMVWYNYWDACIKEEKDFWARFNYIHHNPVKHGYVARMEDYEYSSYKKWLEEKGVEWINDAFEKYPIVDFTNGDE